MPILWCANSLANSFEAKRRKHGRNATGGSIIIIEPLRRSCLTVSGRWSRFSWQSSAGAMPGCFAQALHEVYIPRIQRGDTCFAATVLGARGPLLSVLGHFFEHGRWGSPVKAAVEEQSLTAEDQLFILMQAATCLTATRGVGAPETRICYEHAESLSHLLGRPPLMRALLGQWRYTLVTDKLSAAMQIAERLYSLAQKQA